MGVTGECILWPFISCLRKLRIDIGITDVNIHFLNSED